MKFASKVLTLGLLLFLPASAAFAQAPSITAIGDVTLNVGATAVVNVVATDPSLDPITLSASGGAFATLNAPTTGTGIVVTTLTLIPTVTDAGTHTITVTATAAGQTDTETFLVHVNAVGSNLAPVVVAPAVETVNTGGLVHFVVNASDANGDAITFLSASGLPTGATFTTNSSNTEGTFSWTPTSTQAGHYDVVFVAANGLEGSAATHIDVMAVSGGGNHAPVVTVAPSLSVNEGAALTFTVTATDADADHVTLSASGLPSGATFVDNADNTATFHWTPSFTQSGAYTLTFTGNDGHGGVTTATSVVTVLDVSGGGNHAPVVTVAPSLSVNEGAALSFTVTATDADADHVTLTASGLPSGATFVDNGNNTGPFHWTHSFTQSGAYTLTFTGNDAHGGVSTAATVVTVLDVSGGGNHAPVVTVAPSLSVNEGAALSFTVTATDADADHVTLTASGLPSGATFVDNSNNTGTFHWTPGSTQSGTYTLTFTGNDGHGGTNTATTVITVLDVTGGGGGDATATIIGKIKSKTKTVCFRIVPVNGAFDLRNVDVASVTLDFGGGSVHALSGRTHVAFDCSGGGDDGDDDAEECHDCGDGGDHDGGSWGDDHGDGDDSDHEGTVDTGSCVATHLHACFSMHDLRALLGVSDIRSRLLLATISGNLTTGGSFVATIGTRVAHEDNGHGGDQGGKGSHDIHCKTSPN